MQVGSGTTRRDLLALIGTVAGSAAMYQAMTSLGFASDSNYTGPIALDGDAKGASVLILGAGLAGMTAALELRKAGYKVQVLEFNRRPGGRNWTLRGGDTFTELGGFTQTCEFERGLYFNPGPWRIPYHHRALLDYCKRLNVALEPFIQLNHNALSALHERLRRQAAAHPQHQSRFSRPHLRAARQGDRARQARRSRRRRKTRKSCCRRCDRGARSTRTTLTRPT